MLNIVSLRLYNNLMTKTKTKTTTPATEPINFLTGVMIDYTNGSLFCLRGTLTATRNQLKEIFGSPNIELSDDGKTSTSWTFQFADGLFAEIYDYDMEDRKMAPKANEVYQWHIGSSDAKVLDYFDSLLPKGLATRTI